MGRYIHKIDKHTVVYTADMLVTSKGVSSKYVRRYNQGRLIHEDIMSSNKLSEYLADFEELVGIHNSYIPTVKDEDFVDLP